MNMLMVTIQLTGIVIGFVTLRVLVIPLFERTPLNLDDRLTTKDDHVVIAEYQRDTGILLDELEKLDTDYVLIESDEEAAKRLSDDGYQAINGDPEERTDLKRATIERASLLITSALIVTVDTDSTALLVIVIARSLSREMEILVRVTDGEKTKAAFSAGADYVLSIQQVSARLVASEVHGERVVDPTSQIRLVWADVAQFAGESLAEARRNTDRGWAPIGVSRGDSIQTDERTTIRADDEVLIAGSDAAIQEFERTVDAS